MSPEETTTNPPPSVPEESAPSTAPEAVPSEPVVAPTEPAAPALVEAAPVPASEPITPSTPAPTSPPPPAPAAPSSAEPTSPPPSPLLNTGGGTTIRELLSRAKAKIQFRKAAKLERIMVRAREKGSIGNDEAQALLRVSDATATRYLAELVKTGRLRATGRTSGRRYQPVP